MNVRMLCIVFIWLQDLQYIALFLIDPQTEEFWEGALWGSLGVAAVAVAIAWRSWVDAKKEIKKLMDEDKDK